MRKQTMKILSALLCVLMTMSSFTVFAAENTQTAGNDTQKNAVTIYYKGYSNPYIHYQVENGSWTNAPGYKMDATSEMTGYTHTYTIDLGSYSYANVCFNDGHGDWDSQNGRNYHFEKGTYTFKNGVITPVTGDNKFGIESLDTSLSNGKVTVGQSFEISVKLKNATTQAVNKFTYVDPYGNESTIHNYANAYGCAWQFPNTGVYKIRVYSKESYNATNYVMAEKSIIVLAKNDLKFTKTYASSETTVDAGYSLYVSADVTGGVAPYKYEFGYTKDGKVTSYTTDNNGYGFYPKEEGTLTPFVQVTDSTGKTISYTYNTVKVINGLKVTDINVTPNSPQVVGTKLNIKADIINGHMKYGRYNLCEYVIKKDGKVVTTLSDPYLKSTDWTPTEAGNYTITCNVNDISGQSATKTVNFVVKEKNTTENVVTIYYSGYSTPYIHYQIENGSWTNAPGYKMEATSEMTGYTHKYTINLGTKSYVNVCFNDGHGDWDSQNGRNYHFEKGTYTFKNGVITPVTGDNKFGIESLDTSLSNGKVTVGQSFEISVKLKNATTQAVNKFTYVDPYGNESTIHNYANAYGCAWQFPNTGVYKIRVYSKESYNATNYVMAEKSIIVENKKFGIKSVDLTPADGKVTVGQSFNIDVKLDNATTQAVNKFTSVDENGNETTIHNYANAYGCAWQYYKAGTYKIRVYSKESYNATNYVMAEKTVTVVDNKFGIESFNITPKNGEVQLGSSITISVDLKNGSPMSLLKYTYIDSNNKETVIRSFSGATNLSFKFDKVGTYKVKVYASKDYDTSNCVTAEKTVTVVDNKFGIEALNISPADGKITEGDYVDISVKLKNADSSAVNKYTYVDPNGNEHVIHDYAQASGCAWQFNKAGTYKVRVYSKTGYMAKDYVMAEKTVTVEKKSANVVTIYYKGYSTPYIHYQVGNGNWTAVPGVAMTATNEKSGYTHKYTIDLGTSTYANVCFNNGNGSWDSRNGQNYHFEKGTYTFSNGNMTKIAD